MPIWRAAKIRTRTDLFTVYIAPIARVVAEHNVSLAQYADDTQLYISLKTTGALSKMDLCFPSVPLWLYSNGLCLNSVKSEAIIFGIGATLRQHRYHLYAWRKYISQQCRVCDPSDQTFLVSDTGQIFRIVHLGLILLWHMIRPVSYTHLTLPTILRV